MIKMQKSKSVSLEDSKYFEAVGRRKTSVARVRIFSGDKAGITINGKEFLLYFPAFSLRRIAEEPLKETGFFSKIRIEAKITGGGISSQAGALQHGIARALQKFQPDLRKNLKKLGFLRRDSRMKERRKFGLKKARKAPQWSKR